MSMENDHRVPPPPPPPKSSGSSTAMTCFLGCLGVAALGTLVLIAGGYYAYTQAKGAIEKYVATAPAALPAVEYTQEEADALEQRFTDFFDGAESGGGPDVLELTDHEINVLLASRPEAQTFGDSWIHVDIDGDQLNGEISLPLSTFGWQDRYLNASVGLKAQVVDGQLYVTVQSANIKGDPLPEMYLQAIKSENLAADFDRNPEYRDVAARIKDVKIEDDRLKIELKPVEVTP